MLPRLKSPRSASVRAMAVALVCAGASGGAPAQAPAALVPAQHPALWVALVALASQPTGSSPGAPGAGGGAAFGYRLTDQLSATAEVARVFASTGGRSTFAAGLQAVLDSTPIAPYLAFSLVELTAAGGSGLSIRTAAGAEVRISRAVRLGLEGRALTPLSAGAASSLPAATEVALRVVLFPSLLR